MKNSYSKFVENGLYALALTVFSFMTTFALPGEQDKFYFLDHRAGPTEASITSTEVLANGNVVFFGWESYPGKYGTVYRPAIRRHFEGQPQVVSCTNSITSFWGAYYGSATQPDGKFLISGFIYDPQTPNLRKYLLVRCNQNLSIDTTFGGTGLISDNFGTDTASIGYKVFVRPDGRIVVAGSYQSAANTYNFAVAQYNADGSLDSTFGQGGKVSINQPVGRQVISAALQPDGKLVLAGTDTELAYTLTRLLPDGSPDPSFRRGGIVQTLIGSSETNLSAIKLQQDGKILAVGTASDSTRSRFAIARYDPDGTLDPFFGTGGVVSSNYSLNDHAYCIEVQAGGKILVGGTTEPLNSTPKGAVVRYFPDGRVDHSFGREDMAFPTSGSVWRSLRILNDGKVVVAGSNGANPSAIRIFGSERNTTVKFDFDGDGRSDLGFFNPADATWNITYSGGGGVTRVRWGLPSDTLAPADYDGDGKTDIAVFRDGDWYILLGNGTYYAASFGQAGDLPRPGDFDDEDGKADLAVFRPSTGMWYWKRSTDNTLQSRHFGVEGDIPLITDFAMGATTPVVFRPSNGTWYGLNRGFPMEIYAFRFGMQGDIPISADFNGDRINDYAVFRPSTGIWYWYNAYTSQIIAEHFGMPGDIPVTGDYDGDGKSDIAVFRPSNGTWYLQNRRTGLAGIEFGAANSRPIASAYLTY